VTNTMPIVLVPGLLSSPRIFAPILPALWRVAPVTLANHIREDNIGAIARRILDEAPPRFALAGHSMGGYIAFEIIRQAPERVTRLALMNTQARPDTPELTARRRDQMARAKAGKFRDVLNELFQIFVHPMRRDRADLLQLVHDMGQDGGLHSPAERDHRASRFTRDAGHDRLSDPGAHRRPGQDNPEFAIEGDGRRHCRRETRGPFAMRPPAAGRTAGGDRQCADGMAATLAFGHDLRANAFAFVARENRSPTFPHHALVVPVR
jgi:pimeloyl-ACP methyl ester carboxylesterase